MSQTAAQVPEFKHVSVEQGSLSSQSPLVVQVALVQEPPQQMVPPVVHDVSSATGSFWHAPPTQSSVVHSFPSSHSEGNEQPQSTAQLLMSSVPSQTPSPQQVPERG